MKPARLIGALVLGVAVLGGGVVLSRRIIMEDPSLPPPTPPRADARAPAGTRVRVEVLNASTVRGLARRATMHLRDRGFDVVESGSSTERRDTTLVLDRTAHHTDWALLAARAMGVAVVQSRPDSLRHVDLTVLVGANWRPPSEPVYP